jgi:1,4-dihydroxy-2-naphthoyl-CoA hydrolase
MKRLLLGKWLGVNISFHNIHTLSKTVFNQCVAIWFKKGSLEDFTKRSEKTAFEWLGMKFTEIGEDYLKGTLTVDHRTIQPMRILNGGLSVMLAESLCSAAANFCVDQSQYAALGLEINANHLRVAPEGKTVVGTARPIHIGRSTQVWETRLEVDGELICISRMTLAVVTLEKLQKSKSHK